MIEHSPGIGAQDLEWLTVGPEAAALFTSLHHQTFTDMARDQWSEDDFAQILALPTTIALIALAPADAIEGSDAERVAAGFVIFTQVLDESEILTLGVTPPQRQTGIGHNLVQTVLDRACERGVRSIFLEVREDNQAALHLYQRHGFIQAGRRKGYYQHNDGKHVDAIIMRRNIS